MTGIGRERGASRDSLGERSLARELNFLEALTMGIGGIIGGGIYSVIGIVMSMTGPAIIFSFLFCSLTALLVAYNYVKLGRKYPFCGASYQYVSEAFPKLNIIRNVSGQILWLGYIVASGLYSVSFGLYATYFFPMVPARVFSLLLIISLLSLNLLGVGKTGMMQNFIVIGKVLILVFFIIIGVFFMDIGNYTPLFPEGYNSLFAASSLIFIGYAGFEIIGTASEELKDAEKNLGRAIYGSLCIASVLYIGVAIVSIGAIDYKIAGESNAPLAMIATRFLGKWGEIILGFGGLLSTSSALNAALFGASRLSFSMAKEGGLPLFFAHLNRKTRVPSFSLITSGVLIALLSITGFLKDLSGLASLIFLIIFVMVSLSNYLLKNSTKSNLFLIIASLALCAYFMYYALINATFFVKMMLGIIFCASILFSLIMQNKVALR